MEKPRLYFIDNLRILLITLVMMIHLSISYGGEGSWYYKEGQADTPSAILLTWHNAAIQSFSMGLFFMIAGYFTPGSYQHKGPRKFLIDRLLRLGIPMLCYDFVIGPLMAYPLMKVGALDQIGTLQLNGAYTRFLSIYYSTFHIGTGPLWFVEALLLLSICYALWQVFGKIPSPSMRNEKGLPGNLKIVVYTLALAGITFIVRIWLPIGWSFGPLNFQFPFFPQYICMFIAGIVAYHHDWLMRIPDATGRICLCLAAVSIIVIFPALFTLGGAAKGNVAPFLGGLHWQCFGYALWEQLTGVALIIGLPALFHKRIKKQGKTVKAMAGSAYTAYIIHAPVIVLLAIAIRNISLYPLLKFALAVFTAVPLCFALGSVIRKLPLARRIL
jgi:fucose 4-O-acetylase-like acetyltransferase